MSDRATAVLEEVLALSEEEQLDLWEELDATLHGPDPDANITEEEFMDELSRRADELKADPSQGIPWEVVRNSR